MRLFDLVKFGPGELEAAAEAEAKEGSLVADEPFPERTASM